MKVRLAEYDPATKRTRSVLDPSIGLVATQEKPVSRWFLDRAMDGWFVYFIRSGDAVKIGFSRTLSRRLADIQTHSPYTVSVEAVILVEDEWTARRIEAALHKRGDEIECRMRNEWFRLEPGGVVSMLRWAKTVFADYIIKSHATRPPSAN